MVCLVTNSSLTIRPFTEAESPAAMDLLGWAFADDFGDEDRAAETSVLEVDRTQAAFDGDLLVGTLATYSHALSVPGGHLPCAGTTWVAVAPTHRRRGALHQMMDAHLTEVREREEPLAALWASEAAIYGRYGYGVATESAKLTADVRDGLAWADHAPPAADRVRIVPLEKAADVVNPIYEAVRRRRGGMHARSAAWWNFQILSPRKSAMRGMTYKHVAVAEIDGHDAAYAVYGAKEDWGNDGRPNGTVRAIELAGVDPAAEAAMWRYLAGHDLMGTVTAYNRPIDDALPLLVTDQRRVRQARTDALHVRVIDVVAALTGRAYADSAGLTIELVDDRFDHNDGTWRVEVAPEGASVQPTSDAPDLRMPIRSLGSLYLGGMSVGRLAAAGMLEVIDPAAARAFDTALRPAEAPWAPEVW